MRQLASGGHVLRPRIGQLPPELSGNAVTSAALVRVEGVDRGEHGTGVFHSIPICRRHDVQEVPGLIATNNEEPFDPEDFVRGRYAEDAARGQHDLGHLQRRASDHLPHAGFDVAEATQDDLARRHPVG